MQHVLISANKDVVSLFLPPLLSPRASGEERCWLFAAFVQWLREWSPGKPEWAGGGAISSIGCHGVSFTGVYFLFICRIRDMDTVFYCTTLIFFLFFPSLCSSSSACLTNFTEGATFLTLCCRFWDTLKKKSASFRLFVLFLCKYLCSLFGVEVGQSTQDQKVAGSTPTNAHVLWCL